MVVSPDGYSLILGDLRTGAIHARTMPHESLKWGQRLNAAGPMSATIRPESRELARYDLRMLTATVKQFMAVAYGDTILEAGPIITRPTDKNSGAIQLNGLGLWSIFDRRKNVRGAALLPGANVAGSTISLARKHLGSIAAELVRISIEDNPYGGDLPVVLPAQQAGTNHKRNYRGFNLAWLGDDLRELTKVQGGPDLRFRPRFVPGDASRIEWVMEHGKVDILQQSGPDHRWDGSVERSGVAKLSVDQDGSGLGAFAWATGGGQELSMKLATAPDTTLVDAGYPWTEVEVSGGSEEDQEVLQSVADRAMVDASRPWDAWSLTVRADARPTLGSYLPGDWAEVNAPAGYPLSASGKVRVRILAADGAAGDPDVKLSVAPIQGTDGGPAKLWSTALLPGPGVTPSPGLYPHVV